jgi:hypothetical protein
MYCRTSHNTSRWAWAPALLTCLVALGTALAAGAGPERASEYQVKAAFLYNFGQFVDWPAEAFPTNDAPLIITVLDPDPFNGALDRAVAGKSIAGHPIVVKHVPAGSDLPACHILFVPADDDDRAHEAIGRLASAPVLTVGETDAFEHAGGAVRFYIADGKVRFSINPDATQRAGLKVSSKLLSLAKLHKR